MNNSIIPIFKKIKIAEMVEKVKKVGSIFRYVL